MIFFNVCMSIPLTFAINQAFTAHGNMKRAQMVIILKQYLNQENSDEIYYIGDHKRVVDPILHTYHVVNPLLKKTGY